MVSLTLKPGGTGFIDTNGGDLSMDSGNIIGAGTTTTNQLNLINGGIDMNDCEIDNCAGLTMSSGENGIDMNTTNIVGVGGISVNSISLINGGVDMNDTSITNVDGIGFISDGNGIDMNGRAIIDVGGLSLKSGGSGIDLNGTNITEGGTITCATINNTNAITNITIPGTITGTKIFTGSSISMTGTNVILGSSNQTQNQFSTYGYIQQLYTTSTALEFAKV